MKFNNLHEFRQALLDVARANTIDHEQYNLNLENIEEFFVRKSMLACKSYQIESSQSDNKDKVHLAYIFSFFEAVAGNHSKNMGMHYTYMRSQNQTWILNRIALDINYLPNKYDNITVYTWQSKQSAVGFYRDFLVFNENNELLIAARSFWSVMDLNSRTIIPSNKLLKSKENPFILPIKSTEAKLKSIKHTFPEKNDKKISYKHLIGYSDLDANNHVNNTRYINLAINAVDFLNLGLDIESFEVNYTSELVKGDLVLVEASIIEETSKYYFLAVHMKFLDNLLETERSFDLRFETKQTETKQNLNSKETQYSLKALIKLRK